MPVKLNDRIDVHHHIYPPRYRSALLTNGGDPSGWYIPEWTLEADHELCRKISVTSALLSCTAPGHDIESDPKEAQQQARACNEYCAEIKKSDPAHYGFFACVPSLLKIEAALEEMKVGFDILDSDGVILMTRYGDDNHYLGHKDFVPIWDFLNARQAIVFVHPTSPAHYSQWVDEHLPGPVWDYTHGTGRTAIDQSYRMYCENMPGHARSSFLMRVVLCRISSTEPLACCLIRS
jgi:6-methylsalicylate decarboxylase